MRKRLWLFGLVIVGLVFLSACDELSNDVPEVSTHVRFQNNSDHKTVDAIWDGALAATLTPHETSNYSEQNPGTHTIKWMDHNTHQDLTTTAWPSLVEGNSYTFPYDD